MELGAEKASRKRKARPIQTAPSKIKKPEEITKFVFTTGRVLQAEKDVVQEIIKDIPFSKACQSKNQRRTRQSCPEALIALQVAATARVRQPKEIPLSDATPRESTAKTNEKKLPSGDSTEPTMARRDKYGNLVEETMDQEEEGDLTPAMQTFMAKMRGGFAAEMRSILKESSTITNNNINELKQDVKALKNTGEENAKAIAEIRRDLKEKGEAIAALQEGRPVARHDTV